MLLRPGRVLMGGARMLRGVGGGERLSWALLSHGLVVELVCWLRPRARTCVEDH